MSDKPTFTLIRGGRYDEPPRPRPKSIFGSPWGQKQHVFDAPPEPTPESRGGAPKRSLFDLLPEAQGHTS